MAPPLVQVGALLAGVWMLARLGWPRLWLDAGADEPPADRDPPGRSVGFETLLLIAGAGLVLIVEVLYVVEEAGPGRFNTVFKTYAQVWVLWAVAAGPMLIAAVWRYVPSAASTRGSSTDGPSLRSRFAVGAAVLLVLSTSMYGGLALSKHFAGESLYADYQRVENPTLNATAFVEEGHPEEAAAIRWLDRQEGRPVIVTAPGGYRWEPTNGKGASAPSSLTGLPTVLGWHHEIGYRGREAYNERIDEVDAIYSGPTEQRACLLAKHDVRYVYVGPAEEARYGAGIGELSRVDGVGDAMRFDGVVIYPVEQSSLPSATNC